MITFNREPLFPRVYAHHIDPIPYFSNKIHLEKLDRFINNFHKNAVNNQNIVIQWLQGLYAIYIKKSNNVIFFKQEDEQLHLIQAFDICTYILIWTSTSDLHAYMDIKSFGLGIDKFNVFQDYHNFWKTQIYPSNFIETKLDIYLLLSQKNTLFFISCNL